MKLLVTVENFESIVASEDVERVREIVKRKAHELQDSDHVTESGVLADTRGAFFIVDVDTGAELSRLLFPLQDVARIEAHPIYSFEELGELFAEAEASDT